ncbi:MAG: error-prone DNA polymerase [Acidobacteria bacterium]|nr:MAG: error-prone DNA polymerase [Acidobacteriota bacterium]
MSSSYIELHTASAFSFLQGASLPEALVDRAAELGYPAIALLDRDGVYGAPRFHKAATAAGIRPIIGAELTIAGTGEAGRAGEPIPPVQPFMLPVLCESAEGYQNLSKLITRMKMRAHAPASPPRAPARWGGKGEGALTLDDLDGHTRGLVALAGRAALDVRRHGVGGLLDRLVGVFGRANVYVELQRHLRRDEERDTEALVSLASAFGVPTIATNGVRFATRVERPLFDVLTCIHHHTTVAEAGRQLTPNAERYLKPPGEMAELFRDRRDAVARTRELADRLQYTMADLGYRFPDYPVPPGETQASFLRKITDVGARERYRPYHDRARAQIARELDLIEKLELAGYFLIVWDVVNFCRRHDILVQGRGSAANSAVCYSLGITAVDPVGMDLLFERFLSEERGEWPDIDLDLPSGDRREQVIQHVYEKYGRLGAAMTANVITYRGRSAAREVGKVLGFDAAQVDRLAKIMNQFEFADPADTLPRQLAAVGLDLNSDRVRTFARIWNQMLDLPRHLGQHSGGMVICQGQLDAVVPLENASMPGRVVVQWDKDDCADMGIVKVDLLGLGMMAVIQDSLALVNGPGFGIRDSGFESHGLESHGLESCRLESCRLESRIPNPESRVDLAHLPEDPAVYKMLCDADTVGVFQVESRAQMATLPRLKPARFYDIVVQVAIIRPGPIVGQMVHPYLNRRAGREPVKYPHPSLEPILARTLGVPLFQEQLLRMAMIAAGFTGGQAEELRRAFGFKRSERRMKQVEVQLREGMARQGITGDAAEEIIRSITSFALYGFPESHAASFALLAYASAYLKVHYPAAFYTALLNNQPMGFYHPATLVKDAQRRGVRFHPIDVQLSDWDCRVEPDGAIRLGLRYVSGLRQEVGKAIARASARLNSQLRIPSPRPPAPSSQICPKCGCDDASMLEQVDAHRWFCNTCSHEWRAGSVSQRFRSLDDLIARTALRRDEVVTLADIGALNSFGYDRRSALWQAERAVRPSGEMFDEAATGWAAGEAGWAGAEDTEHDLRRSVLDTPERSARGSSECECASEVSGGGAPQALRNAARASARGHEDELRRSVLDMPERSARGSSECECASEVSGGGAPRALRNAARASARGGGAPRELKNDDTDTCPLKPMTESERLVADFAGMGLSIGRHPMALRREELSMRGILRAIDLRHERQGRRVRVAGMVITRQRPGTAKGFVFLTLEDETGIANIIVRPDLFARDRLTIVEEPFLIVDGVLQNQDGVTSVRAEEVRGLRGVDVDFDAHDFY